MLHVLLRLLAVAALLFSVGCQRPLRSPAAVTDEQARQAAAEPDQWMTYGGTYEEARFSPLDEIHLGNVGLLGLARTMNR